MPALPGDVEDDEGDDETDDRVGEVQPEGNHAGARKHSETDKAVYPRVVSVCDERGTVEPPTGTQTHLRGDLVPDEPDDAGSGQEPQMRKAARMNDALGRLPQRDERADEDCEHDREAGETLSSGVAQKERKPERDRGERIPEVMDEVCQERDAQRSRVDERLRERRQSQDREAP